MPIFPATLVVLRVLDCSETAPSCCSGVRLCWSCPPCTVYDDVGQNCCEDGVRLYLKRSVPACRRSHSWSTRAAAGGPRNVPSLLCRRPSVHPFCLLSVVVPRTVVLFQGRRLPVARVCRGSPLGFAVERWFFAFNCCRRRASQAPSRVCELFSLKCF